MLRSLYINNIAIISHLNVDFHDAMTSLTGETGAGKSIVIDALALALGGRAEQGLVRHHCDKAQVIAEFDISHHGAISAWLKDNELNSDENECVLRRNLYQNRPSKSFINDRPVTVQGLKELGDQLVNICGQQQHLNLMQARHRLNIINSHAGIENQLSELQETYRSLMKIKQQIDELQAGDAVELDQIEMLNFLINELSQGDYSEETYTQLDEEQKRLAHATDIVIAVNTSIALLQSGDSKSAVDLLNESIKLLTNASKFDSRLDNPAEALSTAALTIEDVAGELNHLAGTLDVNPEQLQEVEQQLASFHHLARKHRCQPTELEDKLAALRERLNNIENRDIMLEKLRHEEASLSGRYFELAEKISDLRSRSSKKLAGAITAQLKNLNLNHAVCEIQCRRDKSKIGPNGQDSIDFLVSTNQGQPPGPIEKIASGGELSRISLAVQLETTRLSDTPVLVFDEVDAGISGETADIVGYKLKDLGRQTQVICITHLPQVASKAQHQIKIIKKTNSQSPVELEYLDSDARIAELARILSGKKITEESLANAKVMLKDSHP